jgi:hypothetical protein
VKIELHELRGMRRGERHQSEFEGERTYKEAKCAWIVRDYPDTACDSFHARDIQRSLVVALNHLPTKQREIVRLHHFRRITFRQTVGAKAVRRVQTLP